MFILSRCHLACLPSIHLSGGNASLLVVHVLWGVSRRLTPQLHISTLGIHVVNSFAFVTIASISAQGSIIQRSHPPIQPLLEHVSVIPWVNTLPSLFLYTPLGFSLRQHMSLSIVQCILLHVHPCIRTHTHIPKRKFTRLLTQAQYPPSTIHHPPSTVHHPPSTIHDPRSTIHDPPFIPARFGNHAQALQPPSALCLIPHDILTPNPSR